MSNQIEHLLARYVGTGHVDTPKFDWIQTHHRDSLASYIGHPGLHSYFAVAENKSIGRLKHEYLQRMARPCGPPPAKTEDEQK